MGQSEAPCSGPPCCDINTQLALPQDPAAVPLTLCFPGMALFGRHHSCGFSVATDQGPAGCLGLGCIYCILSVCALGPLDSAMNIPLVGSVHREKLT